MSAVDILTQVRGCLLGLAIGDAPGAPVEFDKLTDIRARFGLHGITDTCLSVLGSGKMDTLDAPLNQSKGCGGVMHTAPVGLAFRGTEAFCTSRRSKTAGRSNSWQRRCTKSGE